MNDDREQGRTLNEYLTEHYKSDGASDAEARTLAASAEYELVEEVFHPISEAPVWDTDKIREAFIYDGGESEYHDPINGAQDQRRIAGAIFDRWLVAHDDEVRGVRRDSIELNLGNEIARVRHGQYVAADDLANRLLPWLAAHDAEVARSAVESLMTGGVTFDADRDGA